MDKKVETEEMAAQSQRQVNHAAPSGLGTHQLGAWEIGAQTFPDGNYLTLHPQEVKVP